MIKSPFVPAHAGTQGPKFHTVCFALDSRFRGNKRSVA
jgi:hypothetical protein